MIDPEVEEQVTAMAHELRDILAQNILRDPRETDEPLRRAKELRHEIQSLGFLVAWSVSLNPQNLESGEAHAVVRLYKPKENLSPEMQKIYDDWLLAQARGPADLPE